VLIASAAVILITILTVALWPDDSQPKHQGRKLSQWLEIANNADLANSTRIEAERAVRTIGTNALPVLVKWVDYAPAAWKLKLVRRVRKLKFSDLADHMQTWLTARDERRFSLAIRGFYLLGPVAQPAVTRLKEIGSNKNADYSGEILQVARFVQVGVESEARRTAARKLQD